MKIFESNKYTTKRPYKILSLNKPKFFNLTQDGYEFKRDENGQTKPFEDLLFEEINNALNYAYTHPERYFGINGYLNFWRCFDYVCLDGFRPIRIENLNNHNSLQNLNCPLTIYHFSTAQSRAVMEYKYSCFGHANEIKTDYLEKVFYKWTPENNFSDLHPVSINLWNAVKFDKNKLPDFLKKHSNFEKTLI